MSVASAQLQRFLRASSSSSLKMWKTREIYTAISVGDVGTGSMTAHALVSKKVFEYVRDKENLSTRLPR